MTVERRLEEAFRAIGRASHAIVFALVRRRVSRWTVDRALAALEQAGAELTRLREELPKTEEDEG